MARLAVQTPASFRFRSTMVSHGWIELAPFAHAEDYSRLHRLHQLEDGTVVALTFASGDEGALHVRVDGLKDGLSDGIEREIEEVTRRIFNLGLDLSPFYAHLDGEERYEWVRTYGCGRLLRSPTVWEDLAKTLLTTNTLWSMTRKMVARLTEMGPSGEGGQAFPAPETVAAVPFDTMAEQVGAGYRNAYLHELATRIAAGEVDVEAWATTDMPSEALFKEIRSLKGFGPYAAGSTLKLLGRFDYLALDSAARSTYGSMFASEQDFNDADIRAHYARYGSWKGLVIWMDMMRDWFMEDGIDRHT